MIVTVVLLLISAPLNIVLSVLLFKAARKMIQFDELFELMVDELHINISFFEKLMQKPLFMASPEIEEAHINMNLMLVRFKEFVSQMSELTGKSLERKKLPAPSPIVKGDRPPVVVD